MATADTTGIDRDAPEALAEAENARFVAERPRSMALQERARRSMPRGVPMAWMDDLYEHPPVWVAQGEGAQFTDVDGHTYLDMYVADMSAVLRPRAGACGRGGRPRGWSRATSSCCPARTRSPSPSTSPTATGCRSGSSRSSATQANTEVIRLAREMTGREMVLLFDGKYHGEGDATLVVLEDGEVVPESRACRRGSRRRPGRRSSTTSPRSRPRWRRATSPSCWPSRR